MRSAFVTLLVAAAVAGAALGGGWVLEAAALPPPARADRIAADAAAWLLRYRVSSSTYHLGRRSGTALCRHGWFPTREGRLGRGSLLLLDGRTELLSLGGPPRVLGPRLPGDLPVRLALALGGCTADLGDELAGAAQNNRLPRVERAYVADRPAIALRLPRAGRARLTLYVSAASYRPVAVSASFGRHSGSARIRLVHASPALLARLSWSAPSVEGYR